MPEEFKIKLVGPGVRIQKTIPEAAAHKILLAAFGAPAQNPIPAPDPSAAPAPRDLLLRHGARRIPEKIAVLAHNMMNQGKDSWDREDLIAAFEGAKEPVPGNLVRDITWTIKIGWIAPKPDRRNHFYLTAAGIHAVESGFPAELRRKTKVSLGGRRRTAP